MLDVTERLEPQYVGPLTDWDCPMKQSLNTLTVFPASTRPPTEQLDIALRVPCTDNVDSNVEDWRTDVPDPTCTACMTEHISPILTNCLTESELPILHCNVAESSPSVNKPLEANKFIPTERVDSTVSSPFTHASPYPEISPLIDASWSTLSEDWMMALPSTEIELLETSSMRDNRSPTTAAPAIESDPEQVPSHMTERLPSTATIAPIDN